MFQKFNFQNESKHPYKVCTTCYFDEWQCGSDCINSTYTGLSEIPTIPGGGQIDPMAFEASGDLIFGPNQSNMVSNDSLGLYLPVETLKPILCCILCP